MLRSVDHWELPTWTWANSFTLLFASAQNKCNYVFSSRAVVLPQLEHWGKAWRPQMKSSTAAPAYEIKKRICDPPAATIKQTLFPAQSRGQRMKRVHKEGLLQQQELHESKLWNKATISCIQAPLWKGINIWQTFCKGHKLGWQNI